MNIVLLGPTGSGKGTHAAVVAARHGLRHVSTGDLLRKNLAGHGALGILARRYMDEGELVPDELVDAMIEEWLHRLPPATGALLDGFPGTVSQSEFLDGLLARYGRKLDGAIYLEVGADELVRRLAGRLTCRGCQTPYHGSENPPRAAGVCDRCGQPLDARPDDATDMVRKRLAVFHRTTGRVVDRYGASGRLVRVAGDGTIAEVGARIAATVQSLLDGTCRFAETVAVERAPSRAPHPGPGPDRARLDVVLLGGPGSGKGTQAEVLCRELGLPHLSTGDLFRENLKNGSELGVLAKSYMDRGELVPDDVTESMVEERLARPDTAAGFVLDGFPRSLAQAEALVDMLTSLGRRVSGVLYVKVSDDAIVARIGGRLVCRGCQTPYHVEFKPPRQPGVCDGCGGELYQRDDDNPATVRARLATFHRQTEPLIDHYRKAGVLHEVDGEGPVPTVVARSLAVARTLAGPARP